METEIENGSIEYLGSTPVTINATNGAIVNATFIIKIEAREGDSLRRWADAIEMHRVYGVPLSPEFACGRDAS